MEEQKKGQCSVGMICSQKKEFGGRWFGLCGFLNINFILKKLQTVVLIFHHFAQIWRENFDIFLEKSWILSACYRSWRRKKIFKLCKKKLGPIKITLHRHLYWLCREGKLQTTSLSQIRFYCGLFDSYFPLCFKNGDFLSAVLFFYKKKCCFVFRKIVNSENNSC